MELTLLDHQQPRVDLLKQLLPKFEQAMAAQGKQITVKLIEGPAEDGAFKSKLTLDYNSGNAPDVTSIGAADASTFAASGYLLDLTDRLNELARLAALLPAPPRRGGAARRQGLLRAP